MQQVTNRRSAVALTNAEKQAAYRARYAENKARVAELEAEVDRLNAEISQLKADLARLKAGGGTDVARTAEPSQKPHPSDDGIPPMPPASASIKEKKAWGKEWGVKWFAALKAKSEAAAQQARVDEVRRLKAEMAALHPDWGGPGGKQFEKANAAYQKARKGLKR
jgi:multidrug resistance efflux pump